MKKLKLTLNKETIAKMENEKMNTVKGGTYPLTDPHICKTVQYTDCGPKGIHNCIL